MVSASAVADVPVPGKLGGQVVTIFQLKVLPELAPSPVPAPLPRGASPPHPASATAPAPSPASNALRFMFRSRFVNGLLFAQEGKRVLSPGLLRKCALEPASQ